MRNSLQALADQVAEGRTISAEEALHLRQSVFPDGVVSREEAEVLIALETRVADRDPAWAQAFVEALVDHMLQSGPYPGHVDDSGAAWLMDRFERDGARETEVETLLKVLERCESAPESLCEFVRERVARLLAGAPVGAAETELVRRSLYASAGSGATAVTEAEARWMFALDAESDGRANGAAWGDLFVKAVLNHLMGRRAPDLLEAKGMLARQAWLNSPHKGSPGAFFSRAFAGGWDGLKAAARKEPDAADRIMAYYETENVSTEDDARLTLSEIAWTVGMTKEDGRRTVNETALLAEIRKLEDAQAAAQGPSR